MARLESFIKKVKYSKKDKRFLTALDMAEAKKEEARVNSKIKRGEIPKGNYRAIYPCRCGVTGCIICTEQNVSKEEWDEWNKRKS